MPHECPPAFRIEPAAARTDSAKRKWFDYPALASQPAAMLGVAFRKKRDDASVTQALPD
jgi:hypothetical protein